MLDKGLGDIPFIEREREGEKKKERKKKKEKEKRANDTRRVVGR